MSGPDKLIVGLGNPGADYLLSRHNIGFMAVDALAQECAAGGWQKKFKGHTAAAKGEKHRLLFLKPATFMNLSGESVAEAMCYYKLELENVIVFHDDIDLLPAQIKLKQGGGDGGHNGLRSLDAHIGKDYWRVRLGIGRPAHKAEVTDFVLDRFSRSDEAWLKPLLGGLRASFGLLLDGENATFLEKLRKDLPPPVEP